MLPTVPVPFFGPPFPGGDPGAPWKKGTGTEPGPLPVGLASVVARSQSPFSTPRLRLEREADNESPGLYGKQQMIMLTYRSFARLVVLVGVLALLGVALLGFALRRR